VKEQISNKNLAYKVNKRSHWPKMLSGLLIITILATSIMAYNLHEYNTALNNYYYTIGKLQMVTGDIRQTEKKFDKLLNTDKTKIKKSENKQTALNIEQTKTKLQINAVSHHKEQTSEIYQQIAEAENYITSLNVYLENLKNSMAQLS
jgi:DNA repair ATPase RecN